MGVKRTENEFAKKFLNRKIPSGLPPLLKMKKTC
jgi:hypothetical protein